jgi:hypothetical protein
MMSPKAPEEADAKHISNIVWFDDDRSRDSLVRESMEGRHGLRRTHHQR